MIGLALALASTQALTSLQYYQGLFLVQSGGVVLPVTTQTVPAAKEFVRFRRGDVYSVWDERGLVIRAKNWTYDTRLKELATSPKLFSKEAIHATLDKVAKGERTLDATALSGALRLGTDAFFLPRWIDKKGYTWLEALVKVDLSAAKPKPVLLGRFAGTTLASGLIDHRLFPLNEEPTAIVRKGGEWGIAAYDPVAEEFIYTSVGERLKAYALLDDNGAAYVEAEDEGLSRAGLVDLATGSRTDVLEDRGAIRILDMERPVCALVMSPEKITLRNLQTSAAIDLPPDASIRRSMFGVVAWWPDKEPRHALLLDPSRWDGLADWQAPDEEPKATAALPDDKSSKPPLAAPQAPSPASRPPSKAPQKPSDHRPASSHKKPRL